MKVLNLYPNHEGKIIEDGCFYVRNMIPAKAMERLGHTVTTKFPITNFDFNVCIVNRYFHHDLFPALLKARALLGTRIVYDTDDFLMGLNEENVFAHHKHKNIALKILRENFHHFDLITVSTDRLGTELKVATMPRCKVRTLPNCIDPEDWYERPRKHQTLRIGYAGSSSHFTDLLFLAKIVRELQKKHDFEFHILGILMDFGKSADELMKTDVGGAAWQRGLGELLEVLKEINYVHHPFVPTSKYPAALADLDLDIGLCYLTDTVFNKCKSAIKFYEYAMVNTATIATDICTYKECNYLAKDSEFQEKLEKLIVDRKFRAETLLSQRDYVLNNKMIDQNIHLWEKAYESTFPQEVREVLHVA